MQRSFFMGIDLSSEVPISLGEARDEIIPRKRGRTVAPSTTWRWINKGCKAADGTIVKLEIVRVGGQPMTTVEAVHRFFRELTDRGVLTPALSPDRRPERSAEQSKALRDRGLLSTPREQWH